MRHSPYSYETHCSIDKNDNIYDYGDIANEVVLSDSSVFSPKGMHDIFLIKYSYWDSGSGNQSNPNFKLLNNMALKSSASRVGSFIRLTPSESMTTGSAWSKQLFNIKNGFTSEFSFRMSNGVNGFDDGSPAGADGISFVIQNTDTFAIGSFGGGIGFEGISNSIAIEFDTFKNPESPYNDENGSHIAVFCNGRKPNVANHKSKANLATTSNIPILKADSTVYYAKIEYNIEPGMLKIYFDTTNKFINPVIELTNIKLDSLLDLSNGFNAYAGFTSATGSSREIHDILSWTMCTQAVQTTTGVDAPYFTLNEIESIISPNPASDYIEISVRENGHLPLQSEIRIYDVFGQIQTTPSVRDTPPYQGGEKVRIDVSHLASGMYFVKIGDKVSKFIKI